MDIEPIQRNMTPICWACGQPMEWTGDYEEIELEGGEIVVVEPVYKCTNSDCDDDDDWNDAYDPMWELRT